MRFTWRYTLIGIGIASGACLLYMILARSWSSWALEDCTGICKQRSYQQSPAIERGRRLVHELISPLSIQSCCGVVQCCSTAHITAIADMMAYFDFLAAAKGQAFCEGTFVIEDHSGRVYDFLRSYRGTYRRISSHFNEYAIQQYGLDIPVGKRAQFLFPQRKRHLLFGMLQKGLLFIKPENYGTKVGIPVDFVMHAKEYVQYLGRRFFCCGFERCNWREERIPASILHAWYYFLKQWNEDTDQIRSCSTTASVHGIKSIVAQYDPIRYPCHAKMSLEQQQARQHLEDQLALYDHCHMRRGREVILRVSELLAH